MNYRETTTRVEKPYLTAFLALGLGIASVILAVALAKYEFKSVFAVSFVLVAIIFATYFASQPMLVKLSVIFLGLGIPFNLDVNLFYRDYVGVTSVDIGVSLLCAIALYVLFLGEHVHEGAGPHFRYDSLLFWAPLLYMMAGLLSFQNAASPELVVLELVRLAMLFAIFFIIMNLRTREQIGTFILSLSVGIMIEGLIAYYQYKTGHAVGLAVLGERLPSRSELGFLSRAGGTIGHPNSFAYYFEMLVPLMFAIFLVEEKLRLKLWYLAATLCGLVGMLTTLSRGAWITVPVSLPLVFAVAYGRRLTQVRSYVFLFPGVLVAIVVLFLFLPTVQRRFNFEDYGSAKSRAPLNRAAFSLIKQFPVTGVGLNNLARVFKTYDTTGGSALFLTKTHVVHNLYLAVWSETGTIGLITFAGIFLAAFSVAIRYLFKVPPWQRGVLIGVFSGLLAHAIHGLVDPGFRILMSTSMLFYALIGLIGAVAVQYRDKGR